METLLHALCLNLPGINLVGHTHPIAINIADLLGRVQQASLAGFFPDEIVLCGPAPVMVPYTDPGVPLANEMWARVQRYIDECNEQPKIILIQNHGLIALGQAGSMSWT